MSYLFFHLPSSDFASSFVFSFVLTCEVAQQLTLMVSGLFLQVPEAEYRCLTFSESGFLSRLEISQTAIEAWVLNEVLSSKNQDGMPRRRFRFRDFFFSVFFVCIGFGFGFGVGFFFLFFFVLAGPVLTLQRTLFTTPSTS
jgi:hypothetical protein